MRKLKESPIVLLLAASIIGLFGWILLSDNLSSKLTSTKTTTKTMTPIKVTFNANDGFVNTSSITVYKSSSYGTLPKASRDYYTFEGWYTSKSGGTKIVSSSIVTSDVDHTLYAHWKLYLLTKMTAGLMQPDLM